MLFTLFISLLILYLLVYWWLFISFLMLCKILPQLSGLKQYTSLASKFLWVKNWAQSNCILCSGSHKISVMVSADLHSLWSHGPLSNSYRCWKNSIPYGSRTEAPFWLLTARHRMFLGPKCHSQFLSHVSLMDKITTHFIKVRPAGEYVF